MRFLSSVVIFAICTFGKLYKELPKLRMQQPAANFLIVGLKKY
jgi:hypothetical protein